MIAPLHKIVNKTIYLLGRFQIHIHQPGGAQQPSQHIERLEALFGIYIFELSVDQVAFNADIETELLQNFLEKLGPQHALARSAPPPEKRNRMV